MTEQDQYSLIAGLFAFNIICFTIFAATHIVGYVHPPDPLLTIIVGVFALVQFGAMRAMRRSIVG